jgi:imidazoleglycerol phosphate synthase glutamine amidotransferase subunit HisH
MIEENPVLNKEIMVTGSAISKYGDEFVAMAEYRNYPIFLFQFHFEKT